MGMYDIVNVPCPTCNTLAAFQSKGGKCNNFSYTLANAPRDVLSNVNRHGPMLCENCNTLFLVNKQNVSVERHAS